METYWRHGKLQKACSFTGVMGRYSVPEMLHQAWEAMEAREFPGCTESYRRHGKLQEAREATGCTRRYRRHVKLQETHRVRQK
jgi:hypothetical protein